MGPPNAPLFYGPFGDRPGALHRPITEDFDAWMGVADPHAPAV